MRSDRDPIDASAVKNLDQIQEDDPSTRPSRAGTLVLASLGGACIVFAAVLLLKNPHKPKITTTDPLGELVAQARPAGSNSAPLDVQGEDVTFPSILSDAKNPTTALEAARPAGSAGNLPGLPFDLPAGAPTTAPMAGDKLPVVPLPAQNVLQGGAAEPPPNDKLANMAHNVSREPSNESVSPGSPGGVQLQVSSFKTAAEADAFAAVLRRRGHHAHVESADVKGRGTWYRVKIGPFRSKHAAVIYRQDFEAKERMVTFIVDPNKGEKAIKLKVREGVSNDDE